MTMATRHHSTVLKAVLTAALVAFASTALGELSITQGSAYTADTVTQSSARSESGNLQNWAYTLRPGETLEKVTDKLLSNGHSLNQLLSYNRIRNADGVMAGDTVRIPIAWLQRQPKPATAVAVTGSVQHVSGATGQHQSLQSQDAIRSGDELISRAGAAVIQLADGSTVRLNRNSHLIFNHLNRYGKTGMVDIRMRLNEGRLETEVKPLMEDGSRFEIKTPSAVAAVRGTTFRLATDAGKTELQVTDGIVVFGPPGESTAVPAGYGATSGAGTQNAVDLRKLPSAPKAKPLPGTITKLPQTLDWPPIPGIKSYQVEINDATTGRQISRTRTNHPSLALQHLDNGRYTVKLAAIDRRGISGMWKQQTVDVSQQAKPAQLLTPAVEAGLNDKMPGFSWTYAGDNEVGRVEIATETTFADPVATSEWAPDNNAIPNRALEPGSYYWRVVTEAGGNSVATSEPRPFVINGALPPAHIININYVKNEVRLFWESVKSANNYRLQLAEDPSFTNIIKEANVADTTAALRLIPGRRYFVRLKALSDGPADGLWGPGRELFVN